VTELTTCTYREIKQGKPRLAEEIEALRLITAKRHNGRIFRVSGFHLKWLLPLSLNGGHSLRFSFRVPLATFLRMSFRLLGIRLSSLLFGFGLCGLNRFHLTRRFG
jgi:hypothetical protein